MAKRKKKKSKTKERRQASNHNCYLAVDTRSGAVLASVEYSRVTDDAGRTKAIYLHGVDRTFKVRRGLRSSSSTSLTYDMEPSEQAYKWLLFYWRKWVKESWKRWHDIHIGGGSYWPRKVLGPKKWSKDPKNKFYSFEHAKRDKRQGKLLDTTPRREHG